MLYPIRLNSRSLLTGKEMLSTKGRISLLQSLLATQMCWWALVIVSRFTVYSHAVKIIIICAIVWDYFLHSSVLLFNYAFLMVLSYFFSLRNCCSSLSSVYHSIISIRWRAGVPPQTGRGRHGHVSCRQIYRYTHTARWVHLKLLVNLLIGLKVHCRSFSYINVTCSYKCHCWNAYFITNL